MPARALERVHRTNKPLVQEQVTVSLCPVIWCSFIYILYEIFCNFTDYLVEDDQTSVMLI